MNKMTQSSRLFEGEPKVEPKQGQGHFIEHSKFTFVYLVWYQARLRKVTSKFVSLTQIEANRLMNSRDKSTTRGGLEKSKS